VGTVVADGDQIQVLEVWDSGESFQQPLNVRGAQCPDDLRPCDRLRSSLNQTGRAYVITVQVFPIAPGGKQ